jgi:F-type H+-transporting ATPase subunit b
VFLYPDGTFFVQLINFAIFFAILNVAFLRPVAAAIRSRREYINSLVTDYDRYQGEAKALRERAEGIRAAARREAEHLVSASRAQALSEASQISARYVADAKQIVDDATAAAARELETARTGIAPAVRQIADLMLERVIPEMR